MALKLISTQTSGCSIVTEYTLSNSAPICQVMSHTLKNGATVMIENDAFTNNAGMQWNKSGSAYSFCWSPNPTIGTQAFTYTSNYAISDDFVN